MASPETQKKFNQTLGKIAIYAAVLMWGVVPFLWRILPDAYSGIAIAIVMVVGWLGGANWLLYTKWAVRCPDCNHHLYLRWGSYWFGWQNPFWPPDKCPKCDLDLP